MEVVLDKELFKTLQLVKHRSGPFEPENNSAETQEEFDHFATKIIALRDKGLIDLPPSRLVPDGINTGHYSAVFPMGLTYSGTQVLKHRTYEKYLAELKRFKGQSLIDQGVNIGKVQNSAESVHSSNVDQSVTVNPEIDKLLEQIDEALRNATMSRSEIKDHLVDVCTLRQQLSKQVPNRVIVTEVLSSLGNVASILSLVMQLGPLIPALNPG